MGNEIVRSNTGEAALQSIGLEDVADRVAQIQKVMQEVMREDVHYGVIPGCKKPSMYKPGAEALSVTFQLDPEYDIEKEDLGNGHRGYTITCTIYSIVTGKRLGSGVGYCSTMESKYRYRNAAKVCPECGGEFIIKGKVEYGGGWICFKKKGGCGAKWADGALEIESQKVGKVDNPDIADQYNTVLKMSKKRAYIDGTLTVTGASDIFTQDIEDMKEFQQEMSKAAPQKTVEVSYETVPLPETVKAEKAIVTGSPIDDMAAWMQIHFKHRPEVAKAMLSECFGDGVGWSMIALMDVAHLNQGFIKMKNYLDGIPDNDDLPDMGDKTLAKLLDMKDKVSSHDDVDAMWDIADPDKQCEYELKDDYTSLQVADDYKGLADYVVAAYKLKLKSDEI